ncbi:L-ascorbate metabolism protein UlaG, beta-lactamase superfamily [Streptomyces zhaozhouensis]|uniref:L-ascorbate metabolism protein UlaG, beta-lactamase superfamily n=1 Tax=Streptomyces zhaozhouensis TaxID=1300267 RepID=A0A286DUR6_9ACTN|nr:L-ascorbate metabolism protein UlaG, beta-lactamase superfamily [Streptomyces zhaozhouensis]
MSQPRTPPARRASLGGALARLRPASFGARPTGERLARIRRSPQYRDGAFRNDRPIRMTGLRDAPAVLRAMAGDDARGRRTPLRQPPLARPAWLGDDAGPPASGLRLTWLGHASVLAEIDGHRVLFDPVFGERCSPFGFAGPKRLHPLPILPSELGEVDAVVISHDHYDHLDMATVRALVAGDAVFAVPLGVGAHLEHWGVPAERIAELDWHESTRVGALTLTAAPGQHFCGRGLLDRWQTLWASWVVAGPEHRIYHSGDTGYFPGFAETGREHGPFDATMIQIGAYSERFWPDIHMTPEQGVRAHLDLAGEGEAGLLMPVHWGTFNLGPHSWDEPVELTLAAAEKAGVPVAAPRPGGSVEPAAPPPADPWWRAVARPARAARAGRARLGPRPADG